MAGGTTAGTGTFRKRGLSPRFFISIAGFGAARAGAMPRQSVRARCRCRF